MMRDSGRRITRNTLYLTLGKLLGDLCAFAFLVYFARVFGVEMLGKYAFSMAFSGFLAMFVSMGMNTYMAREVSRRPEELHKYVSNALVTQAFLAAGVWSLIGLYSLVVYEDLDSALILLLIGLYQTLYALAGVFRTEFVVHEKMRYIALAEFAHKLLILLLGTGVIWATRSAVLAVAVYPLGAILMLVLLGTWSLRLYGFPGVRPQWAFVKQVLRYSLPFLMLMLLSVVFDRFGMMLLATIKGDAEAGLYSAPDRLVVTSLQPVMMFGAAMLPVMSRLASTDAGRLRSLCERSMKLVVVMLLPLSTLWFLVSREVVVLVYGPQFSGSTPAMQVLCWMLFVNGLLVVSTTMMMATGGERKLMKGKLAIAILYLSTITLLIPKYGYLALALAKVGAFAMLCLFSLYSIRRTVPPGRMYALMLGAVPACALAGVFYVYVPGMGVWTRAPATLAVSFLLLWLFRVLRLDDVRYVMKTLKGGRASA
ncbi:MAG TPA: flippase [Gammaproteobacteria bacterium]|nr:flippase [Gammaproteobacteria bacterium]